MKVNGAGCTGRTAEPFGFATAKRTKSELLILADAGHQLGDTSERGVTQGLSLMVNYRYDLRDIERIHEAYVNRGSIAASKSVRAALLAPEKQRALVPVQE